MVILNYRVVKNLVFLLALTSGLINPLAWFACKRNQEFKSNQRHQYLCYIWHLCSDLSTPQESFSHPYALCIPWCNDSIVSLSEPLSYWIRDLTWYLWELKRWSAAFSLTHFGTLKELGSNFKTARDILKNSEFLIIVLHVCVALISGLILLN